MNGKNAWNTYDEDDLSKLEQLAAAYKEFLNQGKTERECVTFVAGEAEKEGFIDLAQAIRENRKLQAGERVYYSNMGKTLFLAVLGQRPMEEGLKIIGAHIDSPRLDLKQNPLYEEAGLAYLDTHYYGGIKKYQWVALPLALHGTVAKRDGSVITVSIGEKEEEPVFGVTDLLPHIAQNQMMKKANVVIEGEELDLMIGSRPIQDCYEEETEKGTARAAETAQAAEVLQSDSKEAKKAAEKRKSRKKNPVRAAILDILKEKYGIDEEDLMAAELEAVPAGQAREYGLDQSMIMAYGQDDRVCSYPAFRALSEMGTPDRTCVCLLVDKEEIGSVGATSMQSRFFENAVAELMDRCGQYSELALRRCLSHSRFLSADVSSAFDPTFAAEFDKNNAAFLGNGIAFNKYSGSRGKAGANDANAEYLAAVMSMFDSSGVTYQAAEYGKVDHGGGGTISYILAEYGMESVDCGVPVLSMHAPWEVVSKADLYEALKAYTAFYQKA